MKSDLSRINKCIMDYIISFVKNTIHLPLWNSTGGIILWFHSLTDKQQLRFIQFNIFNNYNLIYPIPLNKALIFACNFVELHGSDIDMLAARETYLFQLTILDEVEVC